MIRKIYPLLAAVFGLLLVAGSVLWLMEGRRGGELEYDIKTRKTVMTVAYKAYANPAAGDGRWYLSKTVLCNKGQGPIRNLEISYQVPDYVSWTTPNKYEEVLGGQTIVDLYYPKLPQSVANLSSAQTATLEVRMAWEQGGTKHEKVEKRNFQLRGVNEIEYTSMPENEVVTWYDMFENTDLVASFVTMDDPVVKAFAAEITKWSGGTTAGIAGGLQEVARFMEVFYNYQLATGMRYAGSKGLPEKLGDVRAVVQSVRLPREVILTGNGLCIELAIFWAAVLEHLGVQAYVAVIPGHAFTIVVDKGQWIPIECTAIGGAGIGGSQDFASAVKSANETLAKADVIKLVDVRRLQTEGIRPPELPPIDLKTVNDTLAQRLGGMRSPQTAPDPRPSPEGEEDTPAPQPGPRTDVALQRWTHPDGILSLSFPRNWVANTAVVEQLEAVAPWFIHTAGESNGDVAVEIYHFEELSTPAEGVAAVEQFVTQYGGTAKITSQQEVRVGNVRGLRVTGSTTWRQQDGSNRVNVGVSLYLPTSEGLIGVSASGLKSKYGQNKALLDAVIESVRVK